MSITQRDSPLNLVTRVAIVTGASSPLGVVVCKTLLKANALVLGTDIKNKDPSLNSGYGTHFQFHQCDLTSHGAPAAILAHCRERFGLERVDILLNIAGIGDGWHAIDTVGNEVWDRVMALNLTAPARLIGECVRVMKEQNGGCIVNVVGQAGPSGVAGGVAVTASRHGLIGVTKNTAWQFRDDGIRCNVVVSGAAETNVLRTAESLEAAKSDMKAFKKTETVVALQPSKNDTSKLWDIANLLLFLSSDMSKTINGAMVTIDGGWSVI